MIRRIGRAALIGVVGGMAGWILIVILILLDSILPWYFAVAGALILFLIELVTSPFFKTEEETQREAARRLALSELDDESLTNS